MPTDNPKISLYVPQKIYDRFKEFQEERKLSMSQAGIVLLAEYFGEEETVKEISSGTTVGGVSLARLEQLENRVKELELKVNQSKTTSSLPDELVDDETVLEEEEKEVEPLETTSGLKDKNFTSDIKSDTGEVHTNIITNSEPQLNLLGEPQTIEPLTAVFLSEKRFCLSKAMVASYKRKHTLEELSEWMKKKDPDGIAWVLTEDGYVPKDELPDELLNKLQKWIAENR